MDKAINEFLQWCNGEIEIKEVPCTIIQGNWGDYIIMQMAAHRIMHLLTHIKFGVMKR